MSASTAILTLFASLPSDEQAETLKMLVDVLAGSSTPLGKKAPAKKTAVKPSAAGAKVSRAPATPRAPTAWNQEVQAVREEYGVEGDEEGNPIFLPNGEYKYVMSWKDAMVEASARRKTAAAVAAAPNPFEDEEEAPAVVVPAKKTTTVAAPAKKPAAAAPKKPVVPAKKTVVVAPEPEPEPQFFAHEDKEYLMAADGACWALEEDGSKGSWSGYFNILSEEFDTSRPDPSL
jgi:hypothetical protein